MAQTQKSVANLRSPAPDRPNWGLTATIKAPVREILDFAAYHLDLGAHRLYIYLDDDNPEAFATLKSHPKIRVTTCDEEYWRKRAGKRAGKRPKKHQVRQTVNATHAYARRVETDWLIHMDVDEFLWFDNALPDHLNLLDASVLCARTRPQELLSGAGSNYKAFVPNGPDRRPIVARLYPQFGEFINGGFLSHLAGKLFVRTGLENMTVKIHNVFQGDVINPGMVELPDVALCHNHAKSWDAWHATYRFRLEEGAYRDIKPLDSQPEPAGMRIHDLFRSIEQVSGEPGLRAFFDEVCADTPELRQRLANEGLLRQCDLQLAAKRRKHFPDFA